MTESHENTSLVLKRCRADDAGYPFGLHAGDRLIAVNGATWHGSASALQKIVATHGQPSLLTFMRDGIVFSILTPRADLGCWDAKPALNEPSELPALDSPVRNWEIMADKNGNHDLFTVDASLLALVAPPIWLAKSRLWSGLAVFFTVIALSLPVGTALLFVVWIVAGVHLWRDGAEHLRIALQMRGYVRRGIVAATSEAEAVALWSRLVPQARFRFAHPQSVGQLQSSLG
ncbi:MAG: hypothetical protein JJU24_02275 [Natronohydrobacter sp.]|nr:hypothetical protein [Natronohydrobacter sp.]